MPKIAEELARLNKNIEALVAELRMRRGDERKNPRPGALARPMSNRFLRPLSAGIALAWARASAFEYVSVERRLRLDVLKGHRYPDTDMDERGSRSAIDRLRDERDPAAVEIVALVERLGTHPLWNRQHSLEDVCVFMEHHVWAVWDFMSLLKAIQAELAPTRVPWLPPADPDAARLINEIVVAEEGDELPNGSHASHFQIYVEAMESAGASTTSIRSFVATLAGGESPESALGCARPPRAAWDFVQTTLDICRATLAERIAAFTIGREEILPAMFARALRGFRQSERLELFIWYLERHVTIDGERHGPLAARLFERLCLTSEARFGALRAALRTLEARMALWNAVLRGVEQRA